MATTAPRPKHDRFSDYDPHDRRGRAALGLARWEAWKTEHPDRAAIVDALPKGREPCQRCGANERRGPKRTKRRWDWDDDPPTYIWMCAECFKENPYVPQSLDRPLDQSAIDRLRAKGIAKSTLSNDNLDPPPGFRVEGNRLLPDVEHTVPMGTTVWPDDDDPEPQAHTGKLDDWFFPRDEDE